MRRVNLINFDETVAHGSLGRNGYSHFAGLSVSASLKQVAIIPISPSGKLTQGGMNILGRDGGIVARAIAEEAAKASPESREEIAAQLRAALMTIEFGATESPDDEISDFTMPMR